MDLARAVTDGQHTGVSLYDKIAHLYDPWSEQVVEDIDFYVEEALRSGGPVLELAVGTGRIGVPTAAAGVEVVGVELSEGMLAMAREAATAAGVQIDLRLGDMRDPPVDGPFPLVVIAFRSLLHMETDADRRSVLRAVRKLLRPDGRLIFDVFAPGADDIAETHGQWYERGKGIFECAEWNEPDRTLVLHVRGMGVEQSLSLAWLSVPEWRVLLAEEGFVVEELYGWFDREPWNGQEDSIWLCRRSD
jgi:SAM-dependent methyltransferase